MTGFSPDWLSMREPYDRDARDMAAHALGLDAFAARLRGDEPMLTVLDLACGTGANLRELAPRLKGSQRWTVIDHDGRLLKAFPEKVVAWADANGFVAQTDAGCIQVEGPDWDVEVQTLCIDLASELRAVPFARARLVTASALLDLVSGEWMDALVAQARAAGAAMLFALTVDGRVTWDPPVPGDDEVDRLFALDQRRDKGFGPSLGTAAVNEVSSRLDALGYAVVRTPSDWHIQGAEGRAMLIAMIEGMAAAVVDQDPGSREWVDDWMRRRCDVVDRTRLHVGHQDIIAS
jgi:SAM-dependent methyltransferase